VWYVSSAHLPFVALQFIDIINMCLPGIALLFPTIPPTADSSFPPSIPTTAEDKGYVGQSFEVVLALLLFHQFQPLHITVD
jgi:hypothetical protein